MKLTRVEVEHFRGYNELRAFDCLADVVIFCGPNGSGKTSFFDAVAWGLFGDITRLRGSRDVVGQSHIRNYFSGDHEPRVSIHLADGDRTALVTRHGSALLVVDSGIEHAGERAEVWIAEQFRTSAAPDVWRLEDAESRFLSAHLLGQEEVAAFLRGTNPRARFDALASILGVDLVSRFYGHTSEVEKRALATVKEFESLIANIDQRLEEVRVEEARLQAGAHLDERSLTLERLWTRLDEIQANEIGTAGSLPEKSDLVAADLLASAETFGASLASVVAKARKQEAELAGIESALLPEADRDIQRRGEITPRLSKIQAQLTKVDSDAETATAAQDALAHRLAEVRASFQAAQATADDFQAFLLSAEPHIHGDTCPVCEQDIDPRSVVARIRERAQWVPESLRAFADQTRSLEEEEQTLNQRAAGLRSSLAALRDQIQSLETELHELDRRATRRRATFSAAGWSEPPDPVQVARQRQAAHEQATATASVIAQLDDLVAQARYLASEDQRSRLADQGSRLRVDRDKAAGDLARAGSSLVTLQGITGSAKASEVEIVRRLVIQQKPLLNALYRRLRPHPVLDQLDVDFGDFGKRGEVYFQAVAGETRANVSAIFSSAQLNAVAVCIFLAVNISAAPAGFALLDDPIQNMDDFNVLGLVDMLRSVSEGRQVVVSTHDVELGNLMQRKLRPLQPQRRTIKHQFVGYDESGPQVETRVDEFTEAPQLLSALLA